MAITVAVCTCQYLLIGDNCNCPGVKPRSRDWSVQERCAEPEIPKAPSDMHVAEKPNCIKKLRYPSKDPIPTRPSSTFITPQAQLLISQTIRK
jgi:hypothetical protein